MSFALEAVRFRHRSARPTDRDALAGVTTTFPAGAASAVLGMSGSGKTTLLNLLGRLWDSPPTAGRIAYTGRNGGDYATLTPRSASRLRRDHFGFVLQSAFLINHLTCVENISVPLFLQGARGTERRARELLARAGMESLADRPARKLSGGERQRAAVLRAVIHDPDVVFADEPFSSLDPHNTDLLIKLFRAWQSGGLSERGGEHPRTLILVTHDLPAAWELVVPPPPERRPPGWTQGGFLLLREGVPVQVGTHDVLLPPSALPGGPAEIRERIAPSPGPSVAGDPPR